MTKKIALFIVVFTLSFWFWVVANHWIESEVKFSSVDTWLGPVLMLLVLAAVIAVALVALYDSSERWLITALPVLTFWLIFGLSTLNLVAGVVMYLISLYAIIVTRIEVRDHTKVRGILAMRRSLSAIIVPILLALSFAFYQNPVFEYNIQDQKVPVTFREALSETVNTFLEANEEIAQETDEEERSSLIDLAITKAEEAFFSFTDRYERYLPPILAFGLFVILWGLSFVFVYLSLGLAVLLLRLLLKIQFLTVETVQVPAEKLIL